MSFLSRILLLRTGVGLLLCFVSVCINAQYKVDRLILSGRVALHYEDYVLSIQYFNQAISQKPYLYEPWQLRAIAKFYLDDWTGAEDDATKAIELNPYITSLYDLRGISRIRLEKYDGAVEDYTKAIAIEPDNRNYWYNRAACMMEQKRYEEALLQLDSIMRRWEKYAPSYLLKAEVYLNMKDTVEAERWIARSLDVDPYNANAWRVRASIALHNEQWKNADDYFSKALHLKPKDAGSLVNRALARLRLNNLRGAMSDYDEALEVEPNSFLAHYNRGLLRQQVGDDNRAIEDFDYVLALEPDNVMALFNRATLLDRTGDLRAAIRDYTKVIDRFPNFWTGLRYRAECYRKLGMYANAERDEFRVLKAQMDKHLGIQQRWSKNKLAAVRKMSDIDPEKYSQIVVDDETESRQEYQSEYRGRIQNRQVKEQYQPFLAMTVGKRSAGLVVTPFDESVEDFRMKVAALPKKYGCVVPVLGGVGEGMGVPTNDMVDCLNDAIRATRDTTEAATMLLVRAVAYSSAQNYHEALKDINDYLQMKPASMVALWQRAVCGAMAAEYERNSKLEDETLRRAGVKSDFEALVAKDSDNANILYCYGTFCARIGEYDKAANLLSRALTIDDRLAYAYYNRGLVYMAQGMVNKAMADFSKAGELGLYSAYSLMKNRTPERRSH